MSHNEQDISEMKQDINQLRRILADQIVSTPANGKSKSSLSTEELESMAKKAGNNIRTFLSCKQKQLTHAKRSCEVTVKKHPLVSLAVATGIGVIATSLLKRS